MAGHHIGVALHDDGLAALRDLPLRQVSPVQHRAFLEQHGLWRVQVLGALVVRRQLAGAEGDDVTAQVPDRPDKAVMEPVDRPVPAFLGQPAEEQLCLGESAPAKVPGERVPLGRRVADAEPRRIGRLESALGQESAGGGGTGARHPFRIKIGRHAVCLKKPAALALLLARYVAALLVSQLDAGPGRQALNRLGEIEAVDLLDELDDVAALGAREAVPQPARRGDVERRRLLLVERAQSLERSAAGVAELQVLPRNLVNGRALADQLDVLVADPACHVRPPQLPAVVAASLVPGTVIASRAEHVREAAVACPPTV